MRRFLPTREQIRQNRWLAWIGPRLHHSRLWRWSRHGVALGVALGVFFGLLVPVAQIPLSAGAAVVLRANLPAAVGSTLVTNPLTFGPIYYAAYRLGVSVTGETGAGAHRPEAPTTASEEKSLWQRIHALGRPLLVGLAIMATLCGLHAYLLISLSWRLWALRKRRRAQAAR
jgi:uncharacterized protein (DUF2062 family)